MPQCPESPLACGAPLPTPRHASCAASLPHALHVRAHDKAQDTQTGTAAGTPLQATSEQGGRSSSLLLTPAARGMSVASHRRGGHPSSASAEPDDRISLEAGGRIRPGARGSRELLRCRCSRESLEAGSARALTPICDAGRSNFGRRRVLPRAGASRCRLRSPSDQQRQQCQRQQHQQPQQRQLLPCTQAKFLQLPLSDG